MRLLRLDPRTGRLVLTGNLTENIPQYAILSHTWGPEHEEVTFQDMMSGSADGKIGHQKIWNCGRRARWDDLEYFWVDTCCIDKTNSAELSEALASMFSWYQNAAKCYVYLSDVSSGSDSSKRQWTLAFQQSRWFTRGWTLQELLAPKSVMFFSSRWVPPGTRASLEQDIHATTGIPVAALRGASLSSFSVKERLRWAEKRQTKREEDKAYCLLGIFNVFLSPIYGEKEHAFVRLKDEIEKSEKRSSNRARRLTIPDILTARITLPSKTRVYLSVIILAICIALGRFWMRNPHSLTATEAVEPRFRYLENVHVITASHDRFFREDELGGKLSASNGGGIFGHLRSANEWSFIKIHGSNYAGVYLWVHDAAQPSEIVHSIESRWNVKIHTICVEIPGLVGVPTIFEVLGKYRTIGDFRSEVGTRWDRCSFGVNNWCPSRM